MKFTTDYQLLHWLLAVTYSITQQLPVLLLYHYLRSLFDLPGSLYLVIKLVYGVTRCHPEGSEYCPPLLLNSSALECINILIKTRTRKAKFNVHKQHWHLWWTAIKDGFTFKNKKAQSVRSGRENSPTSVKVTNNNNYKMHLHLKKKWQEYQVDIQKLHNLL